jgi:hypothetical protein
LGCAKIKEQIMDGLRGSGFGGDISNPVGDHLSIAAQFSAQKAGSNASGVVGHIA